MNDFILTQRQEKLYSFVCKAHEGQLRKYTNESYTVHLDGVCDLVIPYIHKYYLIWEVALCHDLFEDTELRDPNEWRLNEFLLDNGYDRDETNIIRNDVDSLTDWYTPERYPDYNRDKRKRLEAAKLGRASVLTQTVKYADMINNTSSIVEHDPKFAVKYLEEKDMYLRAMNRGEWELYTLAVYTLHNAKLKLHDNSN